MKKILIAVMAVIALSGCGAVEEGEPKISTMDKSDYQTAVEETGDPYLSDEYWEEVNSNSRKNNYHLNENWVEM